MSNNLKKYINTSNQKGVTLIELLVYIMIFGMVVTMGSEFIINGFKATTFSAEQEEAVDNARKATEIMGEEIRGANNSDNGSYPIITAADQELAFYSDINDDGSMERIHYYITGTKLTKAVTLSGTANDYSGTPTITQIADYLNNQTEPLFFYFDRDNTETDVINNIRLIELKVKINVTPSRAPNDYYVESDINLRNLKDNL